MCERERVCIRERESGCVCERERERLRERVCMSIESVCVRESERDSERELCMSIGSVCVRYVLLKRERL